MKYLPLDVKQLKIDQLCNMCRQRYLIMCFSNVPIVSPYYCHTQPLWKLDTDLTESNHVDKYFMDNDI